MTDSPESATSRRGWLRELAIYIVMVLAAFGATAWTSARVQDPLGGPRILWLWLLLVPLYFGVCIWHGWAGARDRGSLMRLLVTQALHWLAFVGAMMMVLSDTMRAVLNDDSVGIVLLMLLTLGTFVAGVHAWSLPICLTGVALAGLAMSVGWIEETFLALLLGAAGALALLGLLVLLRRHFAAVPEGT